MTPHVTALDPCYVLLASAEVTALAALADSTTYIKGRANAHMKNPTYHNKTKQADRFQVCSKHSVRDVLRQPHKSSMGLLIGQECCEKCILVVHHLKNLG